MRYRHPESDQRMNKLFRKLLSAKSLSLFDKTIFAQAEHKGLSAGLKMG
jgi:hypothetical protein